MRNLVHNLKKKIAKTVAGKKIIYFFYEFTFYLISDKNFTKLKYKKRIGKKLNLNNPQTFSEKLNWLRLYYLKPIKSKLADKYEVRDYISKIFGKEMLIPLLGVYNKVKEIDFSALPDKFVLKANHGSGWNIVCRDKSKLDIETTKRLLKFWLKTNYYKINRSWEYKNIPPRIICEKFITSPGKTDLDDYKIHCFNGEPKYIQHIIGRGSGQTQHRFYNTSWQPQEFTFTNPLYEGVVEKPQELQKLLDVAKRLAEGWPFVRIDLYLVDKNIYFGEITFHPVNGMDKFFPSKYNQIWGEMIDLKNLLT